MGESITPGISHMKLYCPRCQDLYTPPSRKHARLDGCAWGPTLPHLFVMQNGPERLSLNLNERWKTYTPKIFGFRINAACELAPQMQWLRAKPAYYR